MKKFIRCKKNIFREVLALVAVIFNMCHLSAQNVHDNNTYVIGNACTGIDCDASGESFGFDIHRYKENILRIHFDDQSTGSSPKNDWRIVINDSGIGGDEYFVIEDATADQQIFRLDAGAPTNALRLLSNGHLGLGTDNAQQDIHLVSGNSPGIRFEQNNTDSLDSQIWEIAANDEYFAVRDETDSEKLPFRIAHKAETNSLVIDSTGNIGIGTISPGFNLHVVGDADITGELTAASDRRLKRDISEITGALETILNLEPVSYHFRHEAFPDLNLSSRVQMGLIAQEVEKVLPDLVSEKTITRDSAGLEHTMKSVNYIQLIPLLIRGLQEQQVALQSQALRIQKLESDHAAFHASQSEN